MAMNLYPLSDGSWGTEESYIFDQPVKIEASLPTETEPRYCVKHTRVDGAQRTYYSDSILLALVQIRQTPWVVT